MKLNDLRASMGASDISYIYLNNHNILKFVDSSSGGTLYIYDENGTVLGTIAPVNGNPSYENRTFDVSFISIDSDVTIKIERFWKGAPNGTYYYSYQTDEQIESMRAYIYGYQSLVNYINCSYDVDYGVVIHDLPIYELPENSFENEGDIAIYMEDIENMTVRQIDLTDLRMQSNVIENAYVSINDENILRFENTLSAKSLVILDSSGNEIDVITPLNTSSSYENVSLNVTFAFDDSNMSIQIETNEKGTVTDTYQYSYSSNVPISSLRAYVDNYESGKSFVSSSYDIYYGEVNSTNDPSDGSSTFITTYSYDSMDRVIQKTLPNGKVITYNYNDQTLLSSIPGVIDNIEYNSMNLMTRKEFSNNIATDLTYDGWTKRLEHISTPGLQDIDYLFDPKGNVLGITDNIINENQYFFYDDLDRLILAGSENYSQSFAYNPLGSILAHRNKDVVTDDEVIFGFEYGNNAGIHAPTRVGDTLLLYDANGNLIEDGSFVYVYNDANRLTEVLKKADNNRSIAQFIYDENGQRVIKTEEGIVSYYISKDYGIDDGEETVYYFANGNRIAKENSEGMFWYLDDHLSSTNVMIDESGQLVERTLYYPFGGHREGGTEKYTFTGKEFDSEIGLYYYGARYYNPEIFVFTQADSIIPDFYNPQALNRYSYCYNNPLKYDDPDGHQPVIVAAGVVDTAIVLYAKAVAVVTAVGGIVGLVVGIDNALVRYYETDNAQLTDYALDIATPTIEYSLNYGGTAASLGIGPLMQICGGIYVSPETTLYLSYGGTILTTGITESISGMASSSLNGNNVFETTKVGINCLKDGLGNGTMSVMGMPAGDILLPDFDEFGKGYHYMYEEAKENIENNWENSKENNP